MASPSKRRKRRRQSSAEALEAALISLDRSRGPLFQEMERIAAEDRSLRKVREKKESETAENPHLACTRKFNRMRITDLEAIDIARAFAEKPHLLGKLPQVYERLAKEIPYLRDNEEPQAFDCPLLEGKNCMVHRVAKPIACLAWNEGRDYTTEAWHSFSRRDKLNHELFGDEWDLKSIPLQLSRFLEGQDRTVQGACGSTLRKKAMRRGELRSKRERDTTEKEARVAERQQRRGRRGAARHERNVPARDDRASSGRSDSRGKFAGASGGLRGKSGRATTSPRRGEGSSAGDRRAASPGRKGPSDSRAHVSSRQARAQGRRGGPPGARDRANSDAPFSKRGSGPPGSWRDRDLDLVQGDGEVRRKFGGGRRRSAPPGRHGPSDSRASRAGQSDARRSDSRRSDARPSSQPKRGGGSRRRSDRKGSGGGGGRRS